MNRLRRITHRCQLVFAFGIALSIASAGPREADQVWFRAEAKPAELKKALADSVSGRWIYHDLDAARAAARKSGKPVLAVFRCVPCGAAQKLDDETSGKDGPLAGLLDRFVCVRVVKMNGVNRHVFEFDRDVQHVAMIMNADGAVYGRWGTRVSSSRTELSRHTSESFRTALERALKLHAVYPANRAVLAGKSSSRSQSPPMPDDMPTLKQFPHNPPEVKNCQPGRRDPARLRPLRLPLFRNLHA